MLQRMEHVEDKQSNRQQDADEDDVETEGPRRSHLRFMCQIYSLSSRMPHTCIQNDTKQLLYHVQEYCSMKKRV